jgi:hypothetical protein
MIIPKGPKHTFEKPKQLHSSNSDHGQKGKGAKWRQPWWNLAAVPLPPLGQWQPCWRLGNASPTLEWGKGGGEGGQVCAGPLFSSVLIHQAAPSLELMLHDCSATWQNPTIKSNLFP